MNIPKIKLQTPDLIIRSYRSADASAHFQLIERNRKELIDYFPLTVEQNTSVMAKIAYLRARERDRRNGTCFFAGIFLKKNNELIGQIFGKDINDRVPKCELGYFVDSSFQGKGYATQALNAFVGFCFETIEMKKLSLRIEPSNTASNALAMKCGFEKIGVARNDFRSLDGRLMDCAIWERISPNEK